MESKLLPLGTVVSLYQNNTKLMIVGYLQKTPNDDKIWDYTAVIYPNGFISPNRMIVFDNIQIEKKFLIGYNNLESLAFLKEIESKVSDSVEII